ncbi:MAG: alpha-1,4-glucan--maltose-1-phosphate maltosyltransferase [Acidimicrobiales bacterium]
MASAGTHDEHMPRSVAPPRVVINAVRPSTPDHLSAKGAVGQQLPVSAQVFADGHDVVAARVRWRATGGGRWLEIPMAATGNDRFRAWVTARAMGDHEFVIDGWVDRHATWRHRIEAKIAAGQDVEQELVEGALLLEGELDRLPLSVAPDAVAAIAALRHPTTPVAERAAFALAPALAAFVSQLPDRAATTSSGPWPVWVARERAAVGAWYELFPRSLGGLQGTAKHLPAVAELGFDVLYLPPIHPIGSTARKGPGNTLHAGPSDPGSPWAIGSPDGGHDAVAPELGTIDDFDDLVVEATRLGLDVALDFALQCSPDHPWVSAHPEWFSHRPDGSIRFAENPPKQYQDIYPIDFYPASEADRLALWQACLDLLEHWIGHGVTIFRVDNPHTKPFELWRWLIASVHARHPEVVFLAEAFTRPAVMHRLAEIGFSQSYTYFTWRTTKAELTEYGQELAEGPDADYFRPNLWPNTPDILAGPLRNGPPSAFRQRAVLAATLGPSWGIYSGYELCENEPASDANEEYFASEKYEIKARDWHSPRSIAGYIARLNDIRRRHPALADLRSLRFHPTTSEAHVAYSKQVPQPDGGVDTVLTVVSLDPYAAREGTVWIDLGALGLPWDEPLDAYDEITRQVFPWWGPEPFVRLDPETPAHVIHLRRASEVRFSDADRP